MIWEITKAVFFVITAYFAFRFAKVLKRQREWEAQGVVFSSTFAYFYDTLRLIYYSIKYQNKMAFEPLFDDYKVNGVHPDKVGVYIAGTPGVLFTKAKAVEELFTTKNANYSKHEIER